MSTIPSQMPAAAAIAPAPPGQALSLARRQKWAAAGVVLLLTIFAGVIRFVWIDRPAMWNDEAHTFRRVDSTFQDLLDVLQNDGFAPLHYEFCWWMGQKLGGPAKLTPFWMRLIPSLAGTAMVPALYFLARQLSTRRTAILAAAFAACSAYLMVYAHDAKMYMYLWLFCTLNVACLLWWLRTNLRLAWLCWIAAGLGMGGLHAPGLILLALQPLLLISTFRLNPRRIVLFALGICLIASGPIVHYYGFNKWRDRVEDIGWDAASGLGWMPEVLAGRNGPDKARFAASAYLYSWEWPANRYDPEKPAAYQIGENFHLMLQGHNIDPQVLTGLMLAVVIILAAAAAGALPWPKSWRGETLTDPPTQPFWRATFCLAVWLLIPAYIFYAANEVGMARRRLVALDPPPYATPMDWASAGWMLLCDSVRSAGAWASAYWLILGIAVAFAAGGLTALHKFVLVRWLRNRWISRPANLVVAVLAIVVGSVLLGIVLSARSGIAPIAPTGPSMSRWAAVKASVGGAWSVLSDDLAWPLWLIAGGVLVYYVVPAFRRGVLRAALCAAVGIATLAYAASFFLAGDADSWRITQRILTRCGQLITDPRMVWPIVLFLPPLAFYFAGETWRQRLLRLAQFAALVGIVYGLFYVTYLGLRHWVPTNEGPIWMPRYTGIIWPAFAVGLCALIARVPGRTLRWALVALLLGTNLAQVWGRMFSGSEPPVGRMVADLAEAGMIRPADPQAVYDPYAAPLRTYILYGPVTAHPGGGFVTNLPGKYYLCISRGQVTDEFRPAENFKGADVRSVMKLLPTPPRPGSRERVMPPAQEIALDATRSPHLQRLIIWDRIYRPNPPADEIERLLGNEWRRTSMELHPVKYHWNWSRLYTARRREFVRALPATTMPATRNAE